VNQAYLRGLLAEHNHDQSRYERDVELPMEYCKHRRIRFLELQGHHDQELGRHLRRCKTMQYNAKLGLGLSHLGLHLNQRQQ
jgi:hypothetical protein